MDFEPTASQKFFLNFAREELIIMAQQVKKGDTIRINYTGTLEGGEKFDSSEGREPLQFMVGEGRVIKGMDEGVIGMEVGKEKTIVAQPADAYGERQQELVQEIPKNALPEQLRAQAKEGMVLRLQDPTGRAMPARITKTSENTITLDLNHPLAGKVLNFTVKVVSIA